MLAQRTFAVWTLLVGSVVLFASPALADQQPLKIGDTCSQLTFKDVWYLPRSLDDFGKPQAVVLALVSAECKASNAALPELNRLHEKFASRGVQFVAMNVDGEESIRDMAAQRLAHESVFPFVKDIDGSCTTILGATATPTIIVLDGSRRLVYRGRLDDGLAAGGTQSEPKRRDLEAALEDLLAARDVKQPETKVAGTPIRGAEHIAADKSVTFASHISALMQQHCQDCHRPNTETPFSLISYDEVASHGEMVAEVVAEQRMPPWYGSTGNFENHRGLSRDERRLVAQWVKAGMPAGDLASLPPAKPLPTNAGGWLIDEPDLVIKMKGKHELPADGYVAYKYVVLPHFFKHDTWVQECEILPSNPRVVHHCNMAYIEPGKDWANAKFVLGKVPGVQPMKLHDGVGFRFPKGSMLILQIHYTTTGVKEECEMNVGMRFAREKIQKELRYLWMVDTKFAIPPGDAAHRVAASQTLDRNVLGIGLFAHMHLRGKDMSFTARYPDGASETMLVIPNFSFDWQMAYSFGTNVKHLPKGTTIDCVAHYDNSTFNPYNPDPTATVREGQQTFQEMLNGVFIYLDAEENLNLDIDPKTGAPVAGATAQATSD